jgi:hypothetical protein
MEARTENQDKSRHLSITKVEEGKAVVVITNCGQWRRWRARKLGDKWCHFSGFKEPAMFSKRHHGLQSASHRSERR